MNRLALLLLGACSVPALSLDGKQCPCTAGYVCDEVTNRCLATNDGGGIIDTPAATQCLPSAPGETELYRYAGDYNWQHPAGTWSGDANEIHQTSTNVQGAYTYPTSATLASSPDVRVIATMRQINNGSGTPSLGIVLRAQLDPQSKDRYTCTWSNKDRQLRIELQTGGSVTSLASAAVAGTIPPSLTMEASVAGDSLACCIRELGPTARVTATNTTVPSGYSGLQTNRMEAAFGSFVVFAIP